MFYPKNGQNSQVHLSERRTFLITLSINIIPLPICANVRINCSRSLHIPPPPIIIFGDAQINRGDPQIGARGGWGPYNLRESHRGGRWDASPQWHVCAQGSSSWAWALSWCGPPWALWALYCAYDSRAHPPEHHYGTAYPYQ